MLVWGHTAYARDQNTHTGVCPCGRQWSRLPLQIDRLRGESQERGEMIKSRGGKLRRWLVVLVAMGALLAAVAGCSKSGSVAGTYVSDAGYLELNRDGTFYLEVGALGGDYGRYDVKGETLTLRLDDGSAVRATVKGKTISFSPGSVIGFWATEWVKE